MNTLSIEWLKVKKYRTFWVLIGIFCVLLPLWTYTFSKGMVKLGGKDGIDLFSQVYSFHNIWNSVGHWASIFVFFTTTLVIILTTNEYTYRTNRQNIIDGLTRLQYYHTKWLVVFSLAILTTLYVFINGTIFGFAYDNSSNFPGNLMPLLYMFILCVNYYGFGLLLSTLLKRSGLSIALFFSYALIIEFLLHKIINWKTEKDLGDYLPLQASDEMLPNPMLENIEKLSGVVPQTPKMWGYVLVSCVWIVIYYIIGRYRLLKSDW